MLKPILSIMPDGQSSFRPTPPEPDKATPAAPLGYVGSSFRVLVRQAFALLGLFLILIGVPIAVLTPFPFVPIGLPIVILGVVLLGRNSLWGRQWMESILRRYPSVERFAPNWLMKAVFGREKQEHLKQPKS